MKITRAVKPADLNTMLAAATAAVVAWSAGGEATAEPVTFRFVQRRYLIGATPGLLEDGTLVSLLLDEGPWYFDLRGVRVRGTAVACAPPAHSSLAWFEIKPEREVAWDYGRLRAR